MPSGRVNWLSGLARTAANTYVLDIQRDGFLEPFSGIISLRRVGVSNLQSRWFTLRLTSLSVHSGPLVERKIPRRSEANQLLLELESMRMATLPMGPSELQAHMVDFAGSSITSATASSKDWGVLSSLGVRASCISRLRPLFRLSISFGSARALAAHRILQSGSTR